MSSAIPNMVGEILPLAGDAGAPEVTRHILRHIAARSRVLVLGRDDRLCEILSQSKDCAVHFLEGAKVAPSSIPPTRDFDYVAVLDILHEVAKPVEIFIAARRALSRDGSIVVCCQNTTTTAITSAAPPRLSKRTVLKHVYEAGLIVVEFDKVGESSEFHSSPTVRTGSIIANPNDPSSVGPREVDDELSSTHFILHTVPIQSHRHHQLMRLKETRFDRDLYELQSEVKRLSAVVNELRVQSPQPPVSDEVPLHALEDKVDAFRKDIESAILMLANKLRPEALAALLKTHLPSPDDSSATHKSIAERIRGLF